MVFATESHLLDQSRPLQASRAKTTPDRKVVPLHRKAERRVPPAPLSLPPKPRLPIGLQVLNQVQQGSTIVAGFLMTGALVIYGSTVYIDRANQHTLAQIDALQSESQQLTSANEAIKQSLAEQAAQPDSGLTLHESDDMLFLSPAPLREAPAAAEQPAAKRTRPLGY